MIRGIGDGIAWFAREAPAGIQFVFMFAVALKVMSAAVALMTLTSSPWLLLAAAIIAAIGVIVIYWDDISAAAQWAYEHTLKPVIDGLVAGWDAVARGASWMWREVLAPAARLDGLGRRCDVVVA